MPSRKQDALNFLQGGGEMGALMRAHDWTASSIGSPEHWPESLRVCLRLMLNSNHPMFVFWGPDLIQFYNDAYRQTMGPERHPSALGQRGRECWDEIWDIIGPQIEMVMRGEGATWHVDQLVPVTRHGAREDVWWTYGYSPIHGADGGVGGVMVICNDVTEQHRATEDLRKTGDHLRAETELLRDLFEQTPSFMAMLKGPDHVFELVNNGYRNLIGGRDVLGRPLREALPEIDSQGFIALLDRVYRTGEPFLGRELPVELVGDDGKASVRFLDFIYQPMRDRAGEVYGIFVEGVDVTERRRAEQAARDVDIGRRIAMQAANLGRWDHNPAEDKRFFDARARQILGFGPDDDIGVVSSLDVIHPDDRARMEAAGRQALDPDRAGPCIEEFRLAKSDAGGERWVSVNGRSYFRNGQCVRFAGVMADITERKRAEAALKATEQALRDLNATLAERVAERTRERDRIWALGQDLLAQVGFDGSLRAINPAWPRLLGMDETVLLSRNLADLTHPDDLDETVARLAKGEIIQRFESRLRQKDGDYRWISWTGVPEGKTFYAVGRDITAEKDAAETLRQTEEALRQSQKMEAIGQLTGGVAHDFNNLLTGIMGALDLMRRRIETGQLKDMERLMDAAQASASRAAALTHRLLAFSRRQSLDTTRVDTDSLVRMMEDLLHRTLGEHIELVTELPQGVWPALADANQLENAILNLSINARDAMPAGGTLTIGTSNVTVGASDPAGIDGLNPGDYVRIKVTDTGDGMTPEIMARVFDPFFTTKPIGQGTGLGLSMVYGFVQQSGGHVRLTSAPGQGTSIELYLPRAPDDAEPVTPEVPKPRSAPRGEGETVLLVEDDPSVRMLVVEVLHELGYRVIEAGEAKEAIPALRTDVRIDLLISDIGLPGKINGRQLAETARQERPSLPILLMTGYAEKAAARRGFLAPGMEMITKPFAMDALAAKVREILPVAAT